MWRVGCSVLFERIDGSHIAYRLGTRARLPNILLLLCLYPHFEQAYLLKVIINLISAALEQYRYLEFI